MCKGVKEKDGKWRALINKYMNRDTSETGEPVPTNVIVGNLLRFIDETVKYVKENYSVNKNLAGAH
uniref:Uncharacterized protein n=1 Tax=viral metagenome TaxID=1070528 RepID=A0A6C0D614_9ZZZZ